MKLPIIPTVIVASACITMVGLGLWQLQRSQWKSDLLSEYERAQNLPAISFPNVPIPENPPLFRKSSITCLSVEGWSASAGRSIAGVPGWSHFAQCRTGAEGPGVKVDIGWSKSPANPVWAGGTVTGIIGSDTQQIVRLVSDSPLVPGYKASARPSLDDIPNNHMAYAVQWFLFAAIAALIYGLALRSRKRG
jgi:surfeit locus 1 family protein